MAADLTCAACEKNDNVVALACLHGVHAACFNKTCPTCDNEACFLAQALEANGLADRGRHAHFNRLPRRTIAKDNGMVLNVYSPRTVSMQRECEGKWIMCLHASTLEVWFFSDDNVARWIGPASDAFLETSHVEVARGVAPTDQCLTQVMQFLEIVAHLE